MNPRALRLALWLSLVPAAFAAGGLAARGALRAAPPSLATDLAQPLIVVTSWHALGAALWAILALSVAGAAIGTLGALRRIADPNLTPRVGATLVAAAVVAALAAALSWPVIFSSDVYAYAAYGAEALGHLDPYAPLGAHIAAARPAVGPLLAAAAWQWNGTIPACVYGPAFVAFARALVVAGGQDPLRVLAVFRLAACAAYLIACLALVAALPPKRGVRPDARLGVMVAFGLNPVALWSVAEGHNDALMLAVALTGAALARRAPFVGAIAIGLSALVKVPGIAAGAAVAGFAALGTPGKMGRLFAGIVLGGAAAAAFALPRALAVAGSLQRQHAHYAPAFSLQAIGAMAGGELWSVPLGAALGIAAALLLCGFAALRGVVALRVGDRSGLAWLAIAGWLAVPNPYPWYALWILPVAVLALDARPFVALWAVTISIVVRYLPDAYGGLPAEQQTVIVAIELLPLLYALRALPALGRSKEPALP